MSKGFFDVPIAVNEPILNYAPGSPEKTELKDMLKKLKSTKVDLPLYIGGKGVKTGKRIAMHPPHELSHTLGHYHQGNGNHVDAAINAALKAAPAWAAMSWEHRASIFLKAAELLAGPFRARMNAATMLCQSKNVFQAEIDAACELIDSGNKKILIDNETGQTSVVKQPRPRYLKIID